MLRPLILFGFAVVVVSTFFTWSDNPPFSESGIERTAGLFALIASAGAGVIALLDRRPRGAIIAVSAASLALIAIIADILEISSGTGSIDTGLLLALAGALLAIVASGLLTFSLFKKPAITERDAHR